MRILTSIAMSIAIATVLFAQPVLAQEAISTVEATELLASEQVESIEIPRKELPPREKSFSEESYTPLSDLPTNEDSQGLQNPLVIDRNNFWSFARERLRHIFGLHEDLKDPYKCS